MCSHVCVVKKVVKGVVPHSKNFRDFFMNNFRVHSKYKIRKPFQKISIPCRVISVQSLAKKFKLVAFPPFLPILRGYSWTIQKFKFNSKMPENGQKLFGVTKLDQIESKKSLVNLHTTHYFNNSGKCGMPLIWIFSRNFER